MWGFEYKNLNFSIIPKCLIKQDLMLVFKLSLTNFYV